MRHAGEQESTVGCGNHPADTRRGMTVVEDEEGRRGGSCVVSKTIL